MEQESGTEFPGFRTYLLHRDEHTCRRLPPTPTRLQRRAPCPLNLNNGSNHNLGCFSIDSSASSSLTSSGSGANEASASFYAGKDPIPLLSPLVIMPPSLTDSSTSR
ncbi:uncharacterized protein LOC116212245 [Punica granatum]|uniref:Uncharacterized protein n=2 Tax=Punica granatum TaxID=22663 RepID=A0A218WV65_PUNGR|nr:uncharacterized protein LOC116212245 [Punica granatum]OWM75872.1 hypothetical protein CDL15_Pgr009516 [Punica granatum]PKI64452.1 hypothetical protein CRG98_015177 [Punica granatum]